MIPSNFTVISSAITDKIIRSNNIATSFRLLLESMSSLNIVPMNESIMDRASILTSRLSDKPK